MRINMRIIKFLMNENFYVKIFMGWKSIQILCVAIGIP